MRAIKHEPSPASGAAGAGAALLLQDPGATESQASHTCMDQIAGMKEKFPFLLPILLTFHPLPLLSGPFPLGDVGRGSVAVQLLGRLAEKLLPRPAGKLEKSYFVLGCIQRVLMSWEGSAGLAKISLLLPLSSPRNFKATALG